MFLSEERDMDRSEEMKRARLARQQHVLTWGGSGLTQAVYCRQHNLNATTFSGWLRHARAGTARETQLGASGRAQAPLTALAVIVSAETDRHMPRGTGTHRCDDHRRGWLTDQHRQRQQRTNHDPDTRRITG